MINRVLFSAVFMLILSQACARPNQPEIQIPIKVRPTDAGPIIVGSGAGESEYSILFARLHLDDLLAICAADQCQLTSDQKLWLRIARGSAQNAPEAIFKNHTVLGDHKYEKHSAENQVWFNQDLLWLDTARTVPYQVADAVVLWLDVLLGEKDIPKPDLSILEIELGTALKNQVQTIHSSGETTSGFSAVLWTHQDMNDDLYLRDQALQTFSIKENLASSSLCSANNLSNLKFYSARWNNIAEQKSGATQLNLRLEVSATWSCGTEVHRGRILVAMTAQKKDVYEIDPKSIRTFEEGELN